MHRKNSDEAYVIDLCDEVLGRRALRQHRFDFLRGDAGTRLPVDAYYLSLNLAVEYKEKQHFETVPHFDKPHRMTVTGVHRGEQREIYDQRRRELLPRNGIDLVEIPYSAFPCDSKGRLLRNRIDDLPIAKKYLPKWIN